MNNKEALLTTEQYGLLEKQMLADAEATKKTETSNKNHGGHICPFDQAFLSDEEIQKIVAVFSPDPKKEETAEEKEERELIKNTTIQEINSLLGLCVQEEKCPDLKNCPWQKRFQ